MDRESGEALTITAASERDVPLVLSFIRKLAEYEKLSDQMVATEELLREGLFGPRRVAEVVLAYLAGEPVGFALYFHNFSTFVGRPVSISRISLWSRPTAAKEWARRC